MLESTIIKAMLNYDLYSQYYPVLVEMKEDFEKEVLLMLNAVKEYYKQYPDQKEISPKELFVYFEYLHPTLDKTGFLDILMAEVRDSGAINPRLTKDALNQLTQRHILSKIQKDSLLALQKGDKDCLQKIEEYIGDYQSIIGKVENDSVGYDWSDISKVLEDASPKSGIPWPIGWLNDTTGPLLKGTLGHIFARSETGKTSFGIYCAVKFANHLKRKDAVLYLCNEEPAYRMASRALCSHYGLNQKSLTENKDKLRDMWIKSNVAKCMRIIDSQNTLGDIEKNIHLCKPRVCIIDQGPKVQLSNKSLAKVEALQKLYERYRQLAKEYECVILTLGQADNDSTGKMWLSMSNVDSSKVGVVGECDILIGIGKKEDTQEPIRYFNVCKNKLTGLLSKGRINFDFQTATYADLGIRSFLKDDIPSGS